MFAEILKKLRESRHLKQKELADMLYISPSAISQYENGRTRPSRDNLEALAKFFNVSTDYLLGYSPNADIEDRMNQLYCGELSVAELLEKCMNVRGKDRATLVSVVDALVLLSEKQGGK